MKIILQIAASIMLMVTFNGCLHHEGPYQPEYVTKNLYLNKSKVNKKVTVREHNIQTIERSPNSFKGNKITMEMYSSEIADNVTKLFMEQYFDNVYYSSETTNTSFLDIDVVIKGYEFALPLLSDSVEMDITLEAIVRKNGKEILREEYTEDVSNSNILSFTFLTGGDWTLLGQIRETFHKGVLYILETQVKPDLLKALKENI